MEAEASAKVALAFFEAVRSRLAAINAVHEDFSLSNGNVSLFLIDPDGRMYGEMYGDDKLRARGTSKTAWTKATQVWLTGYPTGTYEELVYGKKLDPKKFGIIKPDFIGWEGGHPVDLGPAGVWAAAMSGYRGATDTKLVLEAASEVAAKLASPRS